MINDFPNGSKVIIMPRGTFRNIPHPRYRGKNAIVIARRGDAYEVEIMVSKSKSRRIIVPQMHLEKANV